MGDKKYIPGNEIVFEDEITVRDYFAAKAMQAWIIKTPTYSEACDFDYAKWAYETADAMMKEREK